MKWYREAELIHGRWAMAAVLGIFVGQAWSGIPWFEAGADPGAIAPFSFGTLLGTQLILMGWVESKRWVDFFDPDSQSVEWATPWSKTAENFANFTGEQGYPGGKFFDPLALAGTLNNGVYVPQELFLYRNSYVEGILVFITSCLCIRSSIAFISQFNLFFLSQFILFFIKHVVQLRQNVHSFASVN